MQYVRTREKKRVYLLTRRLDARFAIWLDEISEVGRLPKTAVSLMPGATHPETILLHGEPVTVLEPKLLHGHAHPLACFFFVTRSPRFAVAVDELLGFTHEDVTLAAPDASMVQPLLAEVVIAGSLATLLTSAALAQRYSSGVLGSAARQVLPHDR